MLNAFRHRRSNQALRCQCHAGYPGAQRLPASEIKSIYVRLAHLNLCLCSTPSGIGDQINCTARNPSSFLGVLNAFRHRRSNQKNPGFDLETGGGAQRLPASEIKSNFRIKINGELCLVLNAFRHRRSNQGQPPATLFWPATCAQRLPASEIKSKLIVFE